MKKPVLPALLALAALLGACSRELTDAQVKESAHAFLRLRCEATGKMIPGAQAAQIKTLCDCSAERGVSAIGVPELRVLLKQREFSRDAELVMRGIRTDCMKLSGIE
ncbi:MAG: hypothetical protein JNK55_03305 [Rubrivivax sp.]|nr:hypothetical protein [Rubrivivax sp.]